LEIWAYCTVPACASVAEATGVEPVVSPPMLASGFNPRWLAARDLIYFRLHGTMDQTVWYGEGEHGGKYVALTINQLREAELGGAVVLVANCYGAGSPMIAELYRAGAAAVIAGEGPNYAAGSRVIGTDKLARGLIAGLRRGWPVGRALAAAKVKLAVTAWRGADRDALGFRIIERERSV
jgi:hypothetical protein